MSAMAAAIADWSGFVRAFDAKDIEKLKQFPQGSWTT